MTLHVRLAVDSDDEMAAIAALANAVAPEEPTSVDSMRWGETTYPGGARWVAERDGILVAVADVGRIYMYAPDFDAYWATIKVAEDERRQGIGATLLGRVRAHARAAGKTHLHVPTNEARPAGIEFLAHRGFVEYERSKTARLDLAGMTPPEVALPDGIAITSLAERPDLVTGVHAVALEAIEDIPGGDRPMDAGDLAEFRARDVDRDEYGLAGLEIGPLHNPVAAKRDGYQVEIVDHASTDGLRAKYAKDSNVDVTRIEEVDYVTDGRSTSI